MYGFEAISAQNGWFMMLVGITIVLGGLSTLAIIISQLHRVISFYENRLGGNKS